MSRAFDDTKTFGVMNKISNRVIGIATSKGLGEIVKAAINHFDGKVSKRAVESIGNIISQVNKNGIKNPSAPNLKQNAMNGTSPKIGKTENAFDNVEGILNAPTLPVKGCEAVSRKDLGI